MESAHKNDFVYIFNPQIKIILNYIVRPVHKYFELVILDLRGAWSLHRRRLSTGGKATNRAAEQEDDYEENIREKILQASLPFVRQHGWGKEALVEGAKTLGYPGVTSGLFQNGGADLVFFFYEKCNCDLIAKMKKDAELSPDRNREPHQIVENAIETRLRMLVPYIERWPQALGIMSMPRNVPLALSNLLTLVDDICYHAGDKSVDINWYSRRLGIAGIYKVTELSLVQDKSPDNVETWQFLQRRMEEAVQIHKLLQSSGEVTNVARETILATFATNLKGGHYYRKKGKKEKRRSSSSSSSSSAERKVHYKNRRKRKYCSSSESDSEEWVEKKPIPSKEKEDRTLGRDDWMGMECLVPTVSKEKKNKREINRAIIADPGQTDRELNPYWRDGGTGLPSEEKELHISSSSVGDKGLEWYQKAFQRAQETAREENRTLEDVVSERWGSLEKLKALILTAESNQEGQYKGRHNREDRRHPRRHNSNIKEVEDYSKERFRRPVDEDKSKSHNRENVHSRDRSKYVDERKASRGFLKPGEDFGGSSSSCDFGDQRRRKWMKPDAKQKLETSAPEAKAPGCGSLQEKKEDGDDGQKFVGGATTNREESNLNDDQINALAAKLVKAEIMGNATLTEKLKEKLELARAAREAKKQEGGSNGKEETIVLLQTNEKGLTRPLQGPSTREPTGGRRKKHNVATHNDGQRVRYFADDDKYDLKQMFEREKLGSMDDDKEMFLKLAARKRLGAGSDEEDAAFADAARVKESHGKTQQRERNKAIREETRRRKTVDGCAWCLDNKARLKHLVVSVGETCYLCLPSEESLTPLHCLIVPIQHTACGTLLDEDVWEEMHKFRKAVEAMASSKAENVVVFEQAVNLRSSPHMVLHCVLLDKEVGDLAPIYFKKAILDSETEWANNKKVIDIKGPDVRRSVPKGLAYFSVEFPPSYGFAHVIEDEKRFPKNFAQEIIGGMMDLDHWRWRKPQKSSFAAQREKTIAFTKEWALFDFTAGFKRPQSSSSSTSSSDSD